ncbi:hypothetical protein OHS70_33215 [Streptomyces sp. NBC_00390]|uniref:hypothetical protein n=1 Tax=Streptomyces sp. NBC_00390 TaxID=2975736 RepID=UPI002E21B694
MESDANGFTGVVGVWVAGNVSDLMAGVAVAAASGVQAATAVNADLVAADTAAALARRRAPRPQEAFSPAAEAAACERVLGERRHGIETVLSPGRRSGG